MISTSKSSSSDAGIGSQEKIQHSEFATTDHGFEDEFNFDTDSSMDGNDSFILQVPSDSDCSVTEDNSPEIHLTETDFVSRLMDLGSCVESSPSAEIADVEPIISDACELQGNSQESHVSHHSTVKQDDELLPFPNLSRSWYMKEQKIHNTARDSLRRLNPIERDSANTILCMNQSQVQGSLEDNLASLQQKLNDLWPPNKCQHYKAICEVGSYILSNGPHQNSGSR